MRPLPMTMMWVRIAVAAVSALVALSGTTAPARAVLVRTADGRSAGVTLRAGSHRLPGLRPTAAGPLALDSGSASGNLGYHGGPVLHSWAPFVVYWDPSGTISSTARALIERYLTDLASGSSTDVFGVDRQYTDAGGFAANSATFSPTTQTILDTQAYPPRDPTGCPDTAPTYPDCLTDEQLQAELTRLISADGLPTGTGPDAPVYLIVTPSHVNVCLSSGTCADNAICSYHSSYALGDTTVLYTPAPLLFNGASAAQDPKPCQADGNAAVQEPNADPADLALTFVSHELSETVTDPLGTSWFDTTTGQEGGDNCNFFGPFNPAAGTNPHAFGPVLGGSAAAGTLYDQLINHDPYYTQSEWSNGNSDCELQPVASGLTAAVSGPVQVTAGSVATFDPSASASAAGFTSTTWDFGDGTTAFARTGPAATTHAFATLGTHVVSLAVVDSFGNLARASRSVTVVPAPPKASVGAPTATPSLVLRAPTICTAARHLVAGVPLTLRAHNGSGSLIVSFRWQLGDGATASGPTVHHRYYRPGRYVVKLTVFSAFGASAQTSKVLRVRAASISAATLKRDRRGLHLHVQTTGPGTLFVAGRRFHVRRPRTTAVRVQLSASQHSRLLSGRAVTIRLRLRFARVGAKVERRQVSFRLKPGARTRP